MNKKRFIKFTVILTVIFTGTQLCYGMGKRPAKTTQEDAAVSDIIIEETSSLPSEASLLPEQTEKTLMSTQSAPVELAKDRLTRARQIQTALKNAGYDPGPIDGKMGVMTMSAIRNFQKANNLVADGKVGPRTWEILQKYYAGE